MIQAMWDSQYAGVFYLHYIWPFFLKCGIGIYRLRKIIHIEWISLGVIEEENGFNPDLPKEVF